MAKSKPRVKVPKTATVGEVITIKTLISHKMESGLRKGKDGNLIPRQIINKFTAEFEGQQIFAVDIDPAISANPFMSFTHESAGSGEFTFKWVDDDGSVYTTKSKSRSAEDRSGLFREEKYQ